MKVFQVLHSDIPALLPNQEIKFLSESEHPLKEVKHTDTVLNKTRSKRSADDILTMAEIHRLQSYWNKYGDYCLVTLIHSMHLINVIHVTRNRETRDL